MEWTVPRPHRRQQCWYTILYHAMVHHIVSGRCHVNRLPDYLRPQPLLTAAHCNGTPLPPWLLFLFSRWFPHTLGSHQQLCHHKLTGNINPQQAGVGARQGWNFRTRMHSLHWNYQVFPCNICQMFDWSLFCFRSGFRIHFDTEYLLHKATVPHKVESIKPPISYPSRYAHNVP